MKERVKNIGRREISRWRDWREGLILSRGCKKRKQGLMISQKRKGPLLPGIRLHGLPASLDWADDRLAVHHSSLLCCCRLSYVGAKVRV